MRICAAPEYLLWGCRARRTRGPRCGRAVVLRRRRARPARGVRGGQMVITRREALMTYVGRPRRLPRQSVGKYLTARSQRRCSDGQALGLGNQEPVGLGRPDQLTAGVAAIPFGAVHPHILALLVRIRGGQTAPPDTCRHHGRRLRAVEGSGHRQGARSSLAPRPMEASSYAFHEGPYRRAARSSEEAQVDLAFPTRRERATGYPPGVVRGSTAPIRIWQRV